MAGDADLCSLCNHSHYQLPTFYTDILIVVSKAIWNNSKVTTPLSTTFTQWSNVKPVSLRCIALCSALIG